MILNYQDFINHIELKYDKEALIKEFDSTELVPYTPSRQTKGETWFSYQPDWLTRTIDDYRFLPEMDKIREYIASVYGFEPVGKMFQLSENIEIPPHKDMGHRACINIVLSEDPAPVYYKDFGEITYTCAILNVARRHGVKSGPKRKMIKFQLGNLFYSEAVGIWNTKHSIT
jgi:hypothetical protein